MRREEKKQFLHVRRMLGIAFVFAFLGMLVMMPAGSAFAKDKDGLIVSINTNRILEAHPAFAEARETFETELQGMQQQLENLDEEQKMAAQQQMQQQIQQRGQQLQDEAMEKLQKDIEKIAEQKGYDYVVDENLLIAGGKDVTDEIMKELDLEVKKENKNE